MIRFSPKSALLLILLVGCSPSRADEPDYWPTDGWRRSTPEAQGIASEPLIEMLHEIESGDWRIRHVSVIRNSYLVLSTDIHPYRPDQKHVIHSCTKSILATLIGIAMDQGAMGGVGDSVVTYFPDTRIERFGSAKRSLTLEHLLTMTAGLQTHDSYLHRWQGLRDMTATDDWVGYVLNRPVFSDPGTTFEYSNGVSYLLGAILQKQVGCTALDFAHDQLLDPLGITDLTWWANPRGLNPGWSGIAIAPRDLAKLGLLYLHGGRWDDRQVVPGRWVSAATEPRVKAGTMCDSYGYQWWVDDDGYYLMLGYGGQFVFVIPDRQMVVVFNSALRGGDFYLPIRLLEEFILPAVQLDGALPPDPESSARLREMSRRLADPEPGVPEPIPAPALAASGQTYSFEPNGLGVDLMALQFSPDGGELTMKLKQEGVASEIRAGLDGRWRLNELPTGQVLAVRGNWQEDGTLLLLDQVTGDTSTGETRIEFTPGEVDFRVLKHFTGYRQQMTGRVATALD